MLRELKSNKLAPFLLAFKVTNTAGVPSLSTGKNDATITDAGTGLYGLNIKDGWSRSPVVVASPDTDGTAGGYVCLNGSNATTIYNELNPLNASGSAEDASCYAILLGWKNRSSSRSMLQEVNCSRFQTRLIVGQVNSDGTKAIGGSSFTSSKTSTGVYSITFKGGFRYAPVVVATSVSTSAPFSAAISSVTSAAASIATRNTGGSAADVAFNFIALGTDSEGGAEGDRNGRVLVGQRKPRLLAFRCVDAAGTPSLSIGSEDGTVADSGAGTGDWTITFNEPFKRQPIVLVTGMSTAGGSRRGHVHSASSTSVRIQNFSAGGTLTDADSLNVLVIGFDDATEY